MRLPRGDEYLAAVQNPSTAFSDPELKVSIPELISSEFLSLTPEGSQPHFISKIIRNIGQSAVSPEPFQICRDAMKLLDGSCNPVQTVFL